MSGKKIRFWVVSNQWGDVVRYTFPTRWQAKSWRNPSGHGDKFQIHKIEIERKGSPK